MLSWVSKHAHALLVAGVLTGTVLATVAANTTGLLPQNVGAWLAAAGTIILGVLGHVTLPPAVVALKRKLTQRRLLQQQQRAAE